MTVHVNLQYTYGMAPQYLSKTIHPLTITNHDNITSLIHATRRSTLGDQTFHLHVAECYIAFSVLPLAQDDPAQRVLSAK